MLSLGSDRLHKSRPEQKSGTVQGDWLLLRHQLDLTMSVQNRHSVLLPPAVPGSTDRRALAVPTE